MCKNQWTIVLLAQQNILFNFFSFLMFVNFLHEYHVYIMSTPFLCPISPVFPSHLLSDSWPLL